MKQIGVTALLVSLTIGCTSMSQRDAKIVKNIKFQNQLIDIIKYDRSGVEFKRMLTKNPNLQIKEDELVRSLNAIRRANTVSISKLKPMVKGECRCGKSKRVCNDKKSKN